MTSALKNKYIVRSRHAVLTGGQDPFNPMKDPFRPVNSVEARTKVTHEVMHDRGPYINQSRLDYE